MSFADRVDRDLEQRDHALWDAHLAGNHTPPEPDCSLCRSLRPLRLPPGMTWRAHDSAGLGHLLPVSATRYLCDERALPERHAWPVLRRCQRCVEVLQAPSR